MASTKSGSWSVQWHGPEYSGSGTTYISPNSTRKPRMYATVSCSVTRDSESSSTLHVDLSGYLWRLTGGNTGQSGTSYSYGYNLSLYAKVGGSRHLIASKPQSTSRWSSDIGEPAVEFDITWASNDSIPIELEVHGDCSVYEGCSAGNYSKIIGYLSSPSYNPYTPPTAPTSCTVNKTKVKPDGSLSVSWKGESGGTHGIAKFQLEMSVWRNGTQIHSYTRISDALYYKDVGYQPSTVNVDLSNLQNYDSGSRIKLRPRRYCSILYSLL